MLFRSLRHTTTHCNTLQYTATHYDTLRHTATHCNTLQHTATHCDTLRHTATHCDTLRHTATHCDTLQQTATQCITVHHTATHCNTPGRGRQSLRSGEPRANVPCAQAPQHPTSRPTHTSSAPAGSRCETSWLCMTFSRHIHMSVKPHITRVSARARN